MAIAEFHFSANNSLQRMYSATIIVPEKKTGPLPVLYLLHGQSDDHTAWLRRSNIDLYVENLPLIVVMPNTERGWYVDAIGDPSKKFESMITEDLIPFVDATFQTKRTREGRVLAGLSMGGYGAIYLGLKHPDMFCAAHGFSSGFGRIHEDLTDVPEFRLIFGAKPEGSEYDIFTLAAKLDKAKAPKLSFDCGVDDFTLESNRKFDEHLTRVGLPHTYKEYPGEHNWPYWNRHILDVLKDFGTILGYEYKPEDYLYPSEAG